MLLTPSPLAGAADLRWFSIASTAAPAELFKQSWKKVVPHLDPLITTLSFEHPRLQIPTSIPIKLTFNLFLLYSSPFLSNKEVDMVIVPATTGQMGILPGHTATMTELKPGVLSLYKGNQTTSYFVNGGFTFIHPNSITDIITVEAVSIDRIDPNMIQKGLAEYSQRVGFSHN